MSKWKYIAAGATGIAVVSTSVFGVRRIAQDRRIARIENELGAQKASDTFSDAQVNELPAPAQRYFRHAIPPGAPLYRSVRLQISGRMRPREGASHVDLTATQILAPPRGFVWTARVRTFGIPLRVRDHYANGTGAVSIRALGIVPLGEEEGADVTRSSRERLAGESVWLPSVLLPDSGASWHPVDDSRARVTLEVDGESISIELRVDDTGMLQEIKMMRYGDVGVDAWQPIPYGFRVENEETFEGYTIPSEIQGGWWYGTSRFDVDGASRFHIRDASFN